MIKLYYPEIDVFALEFWVYISWTIVFGSLAVILTPVFIMSINLTIQQAWSFGIICATSLYIMRLDPFELYFKIHKYLTNFSNIN